MGEETKKEEKQIATPKEPMMTIPKSAWDSMQNDIATMRRNSEMLLKIADKKALARFYQKNKKDLPLLVHLRSINNKIIVGWDKMPANDVRRIKKNEWVENQKVKVIYEDGKKDEMTYLQFKDSYVLVPCKREGLVQRGNMTAFELTRLDNGQKYTIDVKFVN